MKKNKAMRLASALLVLTLLSTSIISGTFAKYTSQATGSDSARVAKWGVALTVNANDFATEYVKDDNSSTVAKTVVSTVKVVAPGTDSQEENCQATFSITGEPEVAVKVNVALSNVKDVCLPAGTYTDYTSANPSATFTLDNDYYPVVWTLKQGSTTLATGTLAQIKTFLDNYNADLDACIYAANQNIAASFTLDWAWAFSVNDAADTYLGNVAAGTVTDSSAKTEVGYSLTVTATQVD